MNVSVTEQDARALLKQLPDTKEGQALKVKLQQILDRSQVLTAAELDAVIAIVANAPAGWYLQSQLDTALPKLRIMHQRTEAREQGRG